MEKCTKTNFFADKLRSLISVLDRDTIITDPNSERFDWLRAIPFLIVHVACFAVFFVGWSPIAVFTAVFLYVLRMFAITGFYHRYFSHRTFKTSRWFQFVFAVIGNAAAQRGPLWWAAHHRHHHIHSDEEADLHSPKQKGLFWSHVGWFLSECNFATRYHSIKDFANYPELRFLNRFDVLVPVLLAISTYVFGAFLAYVAPDWGTNGWQMLVWGFCISTVFLYHGTFFINSLAHKIGKARYKTEDDSRNSWILAIITLGEGWHNNHHHYPASTRQGFYWWEIDITYYFLVMLSWMGLVWDLAPVPKKALEAKKID
jgi:stearoyl-CoA desaturase (delta-9 desaturase)